MQAFFRHWFSPSGRIGRRAFWYGFVLHIVVLSWGSALLWSALSDHLGESFAVYSWIGHQQLIEFVITLVSLWSNFCILAKRLHDRDKSARWLLWLMVPMSFVWLFFIECGMMPGTPGPNRFGPPAGPVKKTPVPKPAIASQPNAMPSVNSRIASAILAKAERDKRNRR